MGQAKRRKQLDPNYGKDTFIQGLIKTDKHFKYPEQVYIPAFLLLRRYDFVSIYPDGKLFGANILSEKFAHQIKSNLDKFCNGKPYRALAFTGDNGKLDGTMIIPILLDELERSCEWAIRQKVKLRYSIFTQPDKAKTFPDDIKKEDF